MPARSLLNGTRRCASSHCHRKIADGIRSISIGTMLLAGFDERDGIMRE